MHCQAIIKSGGKCSRNAVEGEKYCSQHLKSRSSSKGKKSPPKRSPKDLTVEISVTSLILDSFLRDGMKPGNYRSFKHIVEDISKRTKEPKKTLEAKIRIALDDGEKKELWWSETPYDYYLEQKGLEEYGRMNYFQQLP